jgi:predicted phosphoribosyltransferase
MALWTSETGVLAPAGALLRAHAEHRAVFADRTDAGERLADALIERGVDADVVLGVPRGGLPVARVVADRLDRPLDVVVASKIGAPDNEELAIGGVSADGDRWLNEGLIDRLGVDDAYVERAAEREAAAVREKADRYRDDPIPIAGRRVLIVDDGAATGATAIACCRAVRAAGAAEVTLALPVAPPDTVDDLRADDAVDAVVAVETPPAFGAVGRHYRRFDQVSDERAIDLLHGRSG